ncbi:hypothetical protein DV515_00019994, partial [Chloebia gouldiae]
PGVFPPPRCVPGVSQVCFLPPGVSQVCPRCVPGVPRCAQVYLSWCSTPSCSTWDLKSTLRATRKPERRSRASGRPTSKSSSEKERLRAQLGHSWAQLGTSETHLGAPGIHLG